MTNYSDLYGFALFVGTLHLLLKSATIPRHHTVLQLEVNDEESKVLAAKEATMKKEELSRKLKRPDLVSMNFTEHEIKLFPDVIAPDDFDVCFDDIGGMDIKIEDIKDNIFLPLEMWYA